MTGLDRPQFSVHCQYSANIQTEGNATVWIRERKHVGPPSRHNFKYGNRKIRMFMFHFSSMSKVWKGSFFSRKNTDWRTFISFCTSFRQYMLLWTCIYMPTMIIEKAQYSFERITYYKMWSIVSAWVGLPWNSSPSIHHLSIRFSPAHEVLHKKSSQHKWRASLNQRFVWEWSQLYV